MAKRRANGEGNIRKRKDGRWEGRYTAGYDSDTGKRIIKNVLGKTQAEVKEKLQIALQEAQTLDVTRADGCTVGEWINTWFLEQVISQLLRIGSAFREKGSSNPVPLKQRKELECLYGLRATVAMQIFPPLPYDLRILGMDCPALLPSMDQPLLSSQSGPEGAICGRFPTPEGKQPTEQIKCHCLLFTQPFLLDQFGYRGTFVSDVHQQLGLCVDIPEKIQPHE